MKRLSAAMLLLLLAFSVVSAEDFDFARERDKLYSYFAQEHSNVGKEYAKYGLNVAARVQFERALDLVPGHAEAMKGLGFKKVRDNWVEDKPLPQDDAIERGEADKVRTKPDKKRAEFYKKAVDRLRELARSADQAGKHRESRLTLGDLLYYNPLDIDANLKLGRSLDEHDRYLLATLVDARKDGKRIFENASEGDVDDTPDDQAKALGVMFHRRKGGPIVARAVESDKRAARVHKTCEAALTSACGLLDVSSGRTWMTELKPYTTTVLQTVEQYQDMVEKFSGKTGAEKELSLKLSGCALGKPWGYFVREVSAEGADDILANSTAIEVLHKHRTAHSDPWIRVGFGYLVTGRVLGTTRCVRYTTIKQESTSARREESPDRLTMDARTPEGLRQRALAQVRADKPVTIAVLAVTPLNDLSVEHAAAAFSVMEFLFSAWPEHTRAWLKGAPLKGQAELQALTKALGVTLDDLQTRWREWVLTSY